MAPNHESSTRQHLAKIPAVPCLYRHELNETYYGIKKIAGKRKEHSFQTTERKIAERKMAEWIKGLDKIDSDGGKTTAGQLLEKFVALNAGKSKSTQAPNASIIKRLKEEWSKIK